MFLDLLEFILLAVRKLFITTVTVSKSTWPGFNKSDTQYFKNVQNLLYTNDKQIQN